MIFGYIKWGKPRRSREVAFVCGYGKITTKILFPILVSTFQGDCGKKQSEFKGELQNDPRTRRQSPCSEA